MGTPLDPLHNEVGQHGCGMDYSHLHVNIRNVIIAHLKPKCCMGMQVKKRHPAASVVLNFPRCPLPVLMKDSTDGPQSKPAGEHEVVCKILITSILDSRRRPDHIHM